MLLAAAKLTFVTHSTDLGREDDSPITDMRMTSLFLRVFFGGIWQNRL